MSVDGQKTRSYTVMAKIVPLLCIKLAMESDGALKKPDNQGWAHVVCALYIPEVRFGNVTTMEPIILQLIPQERLLYMSRVGKPHRATVGACMQCNKSNCGQQFHVTCAQSLGLLCEEAGNYLDNVKYCEKEMDSTLGTTASSTSATSIKITTNLASSSSSASKQRKSSQATKQSLSSSSSNVLMGGGNPSSTSSSNVHNLSNTTVAGLTGTTTTNPIHNPTNPTSSSTGFSSGNALPATGAGTNSSTNLKSSASSSSSSYKDGKDSKHSKI
ncbi:Protein AF-10 [Eumeta japonica]|uniref:Protein AF-10 n=1 Tax=Eumeta variegata TaxID=151549 RepID=A0A4C1T146_EUMVA|nr:Protein AF-10 [Eumeta japonica]